MDTDFVKLEGFEEDEADKKRKERAIKIQQKLQQISEEDKQKEKIKLKKKKRREETFPLLSVVADHLEPFILHVAFATVFSGLARSVEMFFPLYLSILIDTIHGRPSRLVVFLLGEEENMGEIIGFLCIFIGFLFVTQSILEWLYKSVFTTLGQGLKHSIRMELYDKFQSREIGIILDIKNNKKEINKLLIKDLAQLENLLLKGLKDMSQTGASAGILFYSLYFPFFYNFTSI